MSIVWKPIPDFESYGEVSNTGLIRNASGVDYRTMFKRLKDYNGGLVQCR